MASAGGSCPGCSLLFPTPRMQQLLGLPAPLQTNAVMPPEIQTASLCTHDATLHNKPCVPSLRQACCACTGLSWSVNGGLRCPEAAGQALHVLPGMHTCISTQEILDRNMGVTAF